MEPGFMQTSQEIWQHGQKLLKMHNGCETPSLSSTLRTCTANEMGQIMCEARDQNILGAKPTLIPSDNISKAFAQKYITAGKAAKKPCILFYHKPCQVIADFAIADCQSIKTNYFLDQIATVFLFSLGMITE